MKLKLRTKVTKVTEEMKQRAIEKKIKKRVLSIVGYGPDEVTIEHIAGREYRIILQARGSSEKTVSTIIY